MDGDPRLTARRHASLAQERAPRGAQTMAECAQAVTWALIYVGDQVAELRASLEHKAVGVENYDAAMLGVGAVYDGERLDPRKLLLSYPVGRRPTARMVKQVIEMLDPECESVPLREWFEREYGPEADGPEPRMVFDPDDPQADTYGWRPASADHNTEADDDRR